jgi:hypothetical protein
VYVAGGVIIGGVLLINDKARRYFGKIFSFALILLLLALVYMFATQGEKLDKDSSFKTNPEQKEQRKSIYYKDPEEKLRESGVETNPKPH